MNNKINESMVYDELGLSPLWVTLSKESKIEKNELPTNSSLIYLKKIKLEDNNILFIALTSELSETLEIDLFKKISSYLNQLSDKFTKPQPLQAVQEVELLTQMATCDQLIFLEQGLDKLIEKKSLTIPYISSVSLKEMVENPEKKRKLWQDIKELSKSTKQ